ncbi:MAG: hypothetical protein IJ184_01115 [Alphaproteobacteria bacterium]|nr:hypothetical protein [Alphaproteobacteria bacterium]
MSTEQKIDGLKALDQIKANLPQGFVATNKYAVLKSAPKSEPLYTSWVKGPNKEKYLGVLQSPNKVKLVKDSESSAYRNIKP